MKKTYAALTLAVLAGAAIYLATRSEAPSPPPVASPAGAAPLPTTSASASQASAGSITAFDTNRPAGAARIGASKAPWSTYEERYRKGDYAWILANARSAPEKGSYTFAIKALAPCVTLLKRGDQEHQAQALERSEPDAKLRAVRREALQALFTRCANLPSVRVLAPELDALRTESIAAGDAVNVAERDMQGLVDTRLPKEARQKRMIELLAMNDGSIANMVKDLFVRPGITLEGEPISSQSDVVAYQAAWHLALCADYGECSGPGSVQGHESCLYRAECDYLDSWQVVERDLPPSLTARVRNYYARVHDNISRGNFTAFGLN